MPRTVITPKAILTETKTLNALVASDLTNGNIVPSHTGREIIHAKNTSGGTLTLTVKSNGGKIGGVTQPDIVYSLLTTEEITVGPYNPLYYTQSDGGLWINPQAATITIEVLQVPSSPT